MIVHAMSRLSRIFQPIAILTLMFSGCTCAPTPPPAPPSPSATVQPATPTVQAKDTATLVPATATEAPPTAVEGTPTPQVDARNAQCEGSVAALKGKNKGSANAEARNLAKRVPELVICNAVASDSSTLCTDLLEAGNENTNHAIPCLQMQAIFHELRAYPNGRGFMFDEIDWKGSREIPFVGEKVADALRTAARSGDVKNCAAAGDFQSICKALLTFDKSLCRIQGKLASADLSKQNFPKPDEGKKDSVQQMIERSCRDKIDERSFLAKGLQALAGAAPAKSDGREHETTQRDSEPLLDAQSLMKRSEFAKAALDQPQACEPFEQLALKACAQGLVAP